MKKSNNKKVYIFGMIIFLITIAIVFISKIVDASDKLEGIESFPN